MSARCDWAIPGQTSPLISWLRDCSKPIRLSEACAGSGHPRRPGCATPTRSAPPRPSFGQRQGRPAEARRLDRHAGHASQVPCRSNQNGPGRLPRGTAGWVDFDEAMTFVNARIAAQPFVAGETFTAADVLYAGAFALFMDLPLLCEGGGGAIALGLCRIEWGLFDDPLRAPCVRREVQDPPMTQRPPVPPFTRETAFRKCARLRHHCPSASCDSRRSAPRCGSR